MAGDDLAAPGQEHRHLEGVLVGLRSAEAEEGLVETRGRDLGEEHLFPCLAGVVTISPAGLPKVRQNRVELPPADHDIIGRHGWIVR